MRGNGEEKRGGWADRSRPGQGRRPGWRPKGRGRGSGSGLWGRLPCLLEGRSKIEDIRRESKLDKQKFYLLTCRRWNCCSCLKFQGGIPGGFCRRDESWESLITTTKR